MVAVLKKKKVAIYGWGTNAGIGELAHNDRTDAVVAFIMKLMGAREFLHFQSHAATTENCFSEVSGEYNISSRDMARKQRDVSLAIMI
jgi:hypothetical protein